MKPRTFCVHVRGRRQPRRARPETSFGRAGLSHDRAFASTRTAAGLGRRWWEVAPSGVRRGFEGTAQGLRRHPSRRCLRFGAWQQPIYLPGGTRTTGDRPRIRTDRKIEGRHLVVVTPRPESIPSAPGVDVAASAHETVSIARLSDAMPIVIGGATVYSAPLPLVADVWCTDVSMLDLQPQVGDVLMPEPAWPTLPSLDTRSGRQRSARYLQRRRDLR